MEYKNFLVHANIALDSSLFIYNWCIYAYNIFIMRIFSQRVPSFLPHNQINTAVQLTVSSNATDINNQTFIMFKRNKNAMYLRF